MFKRTRILTGIQFTQRFIESVLIEINQLFRQQSKRDLSASNMQPALEPGCRKQTPSASVLFSRTNLLYFSIIKMRNTVRCNSVHFSDTCKENAPVSSDLRCRLQPNTFSNRRLRQVATRRHPNQRNMSEISLTNLSINRIHSRTLENTGNLWIIQCVMQCGFRDPPL